MSDHPAIRRIGLRELGYLGFVNLVLPEAEMKALVASLRRWSVAVSATLLGTEALRATRHSPELVRAGLAEDGGGSYPATLERVPTAARYGKEVRHEE